MIIKSRFDNKKVIDVQTLKKPERTLDKSLIAPSERDVTEDVVKEHAAEPIKNIETIKMMSNYFVKNGKYRDNMLFIVGINFGLRVSDLQRLRFANLINDNLTFKETFPVFEVKTRNTRKRKKNRYITINDAVVDAVTLYLQNTPNVSLSDYMFVSESNRKAIKGDEQQFLSRMSIDRILKGAAKAVGLTSRISSHSLRKTFGYHQMRMSNNDPRKLLLLQKIFNHSSSAETLLYIGLTEEEMHDAYLNLNLGSENNYASYSKIFEADESKII